MRPRSRAGRGPGCCVRSSRTRMCPSVLVGSRQRCLSDVEGGALPGSDGLLDRRARATCGDGGRACRRRDRPRAECSWLSLTRSGPRSASIAAAIPSGPADEDAAGDGGEDGRRAPPEERADVREWAPWCPKPGARTGVAARATRVDAEVGRGRRSRRSPTPSEPERPRRGCAPLASRRSRRSSPATVSAVGVRAACSAAPRGSRSRRARRRPCRARAARSMTGRSEPTPW